MGREMAEQRQRSRSRRRSGNELSEGGRELRAEQGGTGKPPGRAAADAHAPRLMPGFLSCF